MCMLVTTTYTLGEWKAFVGECNEQKRQGWLRLHVAWGHMCTDRSVDDIKTYIPTNRIGIEFTSTGLLCLPNNTEFSGCLIRWASSTSRQDLWHTYSKLR